VRRVRSETELNLTQLSLRTAAAVSPAHANNHSTLLQITQQILGKYSGGAKTCKDICDNLRTSAF
jgi:hypothetical protein